jgi:nucleosome binding factor SPN SPT16 subunit
LQINDTVKVGQDKGICITEGVKSTKDTLFYLTREDSEEERVAQKPPTRPNGNASPMKNKTAGGKVLRNKTRGAAQEEAMQSTSAKIAEHQKELHQQLQEQGLARYSEEGDGANGKEGKSWKKFQSYKGEAGLPKEVEGLRVRRDFFCQHRCSLRLCPDFRGPQSPDGDFTCSWVCSAIPHQHDKKCQQERGRGLYVSSRQLPDTRPACW